MRRIIVTILFLVPAILAQPDAEVIENDGCQNLKMCRMYCENGFKKDANGCSICECDLGICDEVQCPEEKICRGFILDQTGHKISKCIDPTLPPKCWGVADMGVGRGRMTRYYYNSDTDECATFVYTGQGGNENR